MGLLPWKEALCAEIWNGNSIYLGSQWTFSLIFFISTMIALSNARFEIKSIYPFTTMLLDIFFPQWLHWSHEAWHDRIIHPHTLFQFLLKCFFLMAIICLNISILTICNWVFLRNSACPVCWWHLHLFVWPAKMTTRFRTSQRAKAQLQKMAFFSILVWGTSGPLPIAI